VAAMVPSLSSDGKSIVTGIGVLAGDAAMVPSLSSDGKIAAAWGALPQTALPRWCRR